jgi:hypothetical protein
MAGFALVSSGQTVSHPANQIMPGSFSGTGLYQFIANLLVNNTLIVNNSGGSGNALTVLGTINSTGNIYTGGNIQGTSVIQVIASTLISLVSSTNIQLNATSGAIYMNSPTVYVNNTNIINYTDDSAPLEIYSGNSTPIACPTGFGLAYYGWAYAGTGTYYADTTAALLGGDLSCIKNSTDISSMWVGESLAAPGVTTGGNPTDPTMWYLVNFTAGSSNNITACTVCYPNGGEYVEVHETNNTASSVSCPSKFSKLFVTDGYIYSAAGEINSTGQPLGWLPPGPTSALTGGGITCVANPAQYVSTILTLAPGGTLPTWWHASGGNYSRCNICYRPSVIN